MSMLSARVHYSSLVKFFDLMKDSLMSKSINPLPVFSGIGKFLPTVDPVPEIISVGIYQIDWSTWQCSKTGDHMFQRLQKNITIVRLDSLMKMLTACCCFYANNRPTLISLHKLREKSLQRGFEPYIPLECRVSALASSVVEKSDKLHTPIVIIRVVRICSYCSAGLIV